MSDKSTSKTTDKQNRKIIDLDDATKKQTGKSVKVLNDTSHIINELNKKHAFVMISGRACVLNKITNPVFGTSDVSFSRKSDFLDCYSNLHFNVDPESKSSKTHGQIWWENPNRKQYEGVVFAPGDEVLNHYNLYEGLAFKPEKGEWGLFRTFIKDVIADGDQKRFEWILKWCARSVKDPGGRRPGVAIILRGDQGAGKSLFASMLGELFGKHYCSIRQSSQLTGQFNSHLKDKLLVFADEACLANNKKACDILKGLITEKYNCVDEKFVPAMMFKNYMNLIIASNHDHIIDAGKDERRYNIFQISNSYLIREKTEPDIFSKIVKQMENGGYKAMLYSLLNEVPYTLQEIKKIETTDALMEQKISSMSPVESYWFERLQDGFIEEADEGKWPEKIISALQYDLFLTFCHKRGLNKNIPSDTKFGMDLKKLCKGLPKPKQVSVGGVRSKYRFFPPLDECRKDFESYFNMKIDWGDDSEISDSEAYYNEELKEELKPKYKDKVPF